MPPDLFLAIVIEPSLRLLPAQMTSDRAKAMLLSIGLHESGLRFRRQTNGPARGFFMFELPGVRGVVRHHATKDHCESVIDALCYRTPKTSPSRQAAELYDAMADNDMLSCCFARLLLWTIPAPLPGPEDAATAFAQYIDAWRPGAFTRGTDEDKARLRATFSHHYAEAWTRVRAVSI